MSDFGFPGTTKLPRVGGFVKCCSLYMALETTRSAFLSMSVDS